MKKFLLFLTIFFFCTFPCLAKIVNATGNGETAKLAEAEALRNAVENVMGVAVDSTTLTTNNKLIEDNILTHSRGYITNYQILQKDKTLDGWQITIQADVDINPNSALMNDLVKYGIIDLSLRNPRIAVIITNGDTAEMEIIGGLIANGFENILNAEGLSQYHGNSWQSVTKLKKLAEEIGADIIITGKVTYNDNGDVGKYLGKHPEYTGMYSAKATIDAKMYSAKATIDAKMYSANTGRIIASVSENATGLDLNSAAAATKASKTAAKKAGNYLAEKLVDAGAGNRQFINLTVLAANFDKIEMVRKALINLEQVKSVQLRSYKNGQGLFQMQFGGTGEQLFALLQKKSECNLILNSVNYDGLSIKAF